MYYVLFFKKFKKKILTKRGLNLDLHSRWPLSWFYDSIEIIHWQIAIFLLFYSTFNLANALNYVCIQVSHISFAVINKNVVVFTELWSLEKENSLFH